MRNSTNFDYCPHLLHFLSESDNNICNCLHEHTPLLIYDPIIFFQWLKLQLHITPIILYAPERYLGP